MALEIREFGDILDKAADPEAEAYAIRTAIQALLFHQIVYDHTHGIPLSTIKALKDHRIFFEKYFSTAGFELIVDSTTQMFALRPVESDNPLYAWKSMRLKKDETLVRLVLRSIFENGFRNGTMTETGQVESTTLQIAEEYERLSKKAAPSDKVLVEAHLKELSRKGVVRLGDTHKDSNVTQITILPGVRIIVSDEFVSRIDEWLEGDQSKPFLEQASTKKAEAVAEDV